MQKYKSLQEESGKDVFLVCLGWLLSMQVWAGSGRAPALLGAGGAGHPLERPSTEACSREAPMPYPQHSYRQLVPVMSGILGQSLRHDLSSRWKWAKSQE